LYTGLDMVYFDLNLGRDNNRELKVPRTELEGNKKRQKLSRDTEDGGKPKNRQQEARREANRGKREKAEKSKKRQAAVELSLLFHFLRVLRM
jgi:hypothetical protein